MLLLLRNMFQRIKIEATEQGKSQNNELRPATYSPNV